MGEASKGALKRGVSPTHELMVDWELQNPGGTLREMGAYFDYSVTWLSTMMNSDAYKAYRAGRLKDVHTYVAQDIPAKMKALAEVAIERMHEVLQKSEDPKMIKESFDSVLNRYGYAPGSKNPAGPGGFSQTNNVFFLSQDQFARMQGRLIEAHSNPVNNPPLPLPASELPAPQVDESEEISSGS